MPALLNNQVNRTFYYPLLVIGFVFITAAGVMGEIDLASLKIPFTITLIILVLFSVAVVVLVRSYYPKEVDLKILFTSKKITSFGKLSLWLVGLYALLTLSGRLESMTGAAGYCAGWPLCAPSAAVGWLAFSHRLLTGLIVLLTAVVFVKAWSRQRSVPVILVSFTVYTSIFIAQALVGARMMDQAQTHLLVLHSATALASWVALLVFISAVVFESRTEAEELADLNTILGRKYPQFFKDLLALTKPIVVVLLLVTTYAGMVIAQKSFPGIALTFWTLLGGFLAAGGSGAINQYIDRVDDTKMQRTQKRPLPSGRLTPGEGLAVGAAMTITAFYIMVAYVNLLAALLTLAGILYYVLLYSVFLKKTTVHNIVIGGGAGAIPPLVGWAAATGSLNIPSLFLFAVVFMWTPPHFWALALVRRNDYARAGVPMLPVVHGEVQTRWKIFLYTIELVALTLFLPLFGLGGAIYMTGAVLLGLWLVGAAFRVWKQGGNKLAWKMYRYSSMYLAFLFLVLVLDRVLG